VPSTRGHSEQTAFDLQELTDVKQAVAEEWQRETSILVYFKRLVHALLLILGGIVTTLLDKQVPSLSASLSSSYHATLPSSSGSLFVHLRRPTSPTLEDHRLAWN
jgi:hypothetical protein